MSATLNAVPAGHVAAVVTYLEMDEAPADLASPPSPLRIEHLAGIDPDRYRALFRRVGSHWLWFSRLAMSDAELAARLAEVHVVRGPDPRSGSGTGGEDAGFIELDFREAGRCAIRFLGLVPELAGQGHGRWLFAETLRRAWAPGVEKVTVHTCSLDHPAALPAYLRAGFVARRRAFESFPDPRLAGLLPRDVAPQIPLVAG